MVGLAAASQTGRLVATQHQSALFCSTRQGLQFRRTEPNCHVHRGRSMFGRGDSGSPPAVQCSDCRWFGRKATNRRRADSGRSGESIRMGHKPSQFTGTPLSDI